MGDRFYFQQQQRGKRRMAWDDDKKAQAVEMYGEQDPTPETSMEIVKEIADELNESPNGVRMILTKAGVYVKKAPATGNGGGTSSGGTRVSKQAAQDALTAAITDKGLSVDEDIIAKLTGKAAQYFTGLLAD
mgnify:CR=1 FL=1|jgi:transposase-like protein|tara:strand:- start:1281 stop:1676 length:396 start_codon:yes stop_codon:yes gene_type:complete